MSGARWTRLARADRRARDRGRRPGVFLDRDGTLIEEVGYVNHLDRVKLFAWSAEAVRRLNQAGLPVVVVTNQSGVARGYFEEPLVRQVHDKIAGELAAAGAHMDAFYYCPHHPDAPVLEYRRACDCRKPARGMVDEAAARLRIDTAASYLVGDTYRDMQLGFNVGARTILVKTGYGLGELTYHQSRWPRRPDHIVENLLEAVEAILADGAGQTSAVASPATLTLDR